ncbi:MAG: ELM1/GtrOC1 family putative glycosyltransferase [Pseudomonadota bacterium]|nr:ELM1/GtrOC1 family putative glycosyltransferase [Pseudomonadota bacterium]
MTALNDTECLGVGLMNRALYYGGPQNADSLWERSIKHTLKVWRFLDGKPGHEKQTQGLLQGLEGLVDVEARDLHWPADAKALKKDWQLHAAAPDLIIGAGHHLHRPMLKTRWHLGGRCVVLMKPSLPTFLFDLALVPEHDRLWFQRNVESTLGMLSPSQTSAVDPARGVVLLGGVSKHFHWSDALVAEQVVRIASQAQDISWPIIDSRRTPESYRRQLKLPTNAKYVHWRDTQPSWLTHQLSRSSATWVTPDSASMVYEALSFSGRVGIIDLRPKRRRNKLAAGVRRLHELGYVGFSSQGPLSRQGLSTVALAEHRRCARLILQRWFSDLLNPARLECEQQPK